MIKVTIELLPFGREDAAKTISEFFIWNTGNENKTGKYQYQFEGYEQDLAGKSHPIVGTTFHVRNDAITELIRHALNSRKAHLNHVHTS